MGQTHVHAAGGSTPDEPQAVAAGRVQVTTVETDELLDEIDSLLEDNAEEFVRSYVQKGGQ